MLSIIPARGAAKAFSTCRPRTHIIRRQSTSTWRSAPTGKLKLYDVPVSNNGARVRFTIYKKGIQDEVEIVAPQAIGGLKSAQYLALNPQGKMPLLVLSDGTAIPESEVIQQYILDRFSDKWPSLLASSPEARARANLATRIHDIYIAPIQGAMYRKMDSAEQRAAQIGQIAFQLNVLEGIVQGPYVAGEELTAADAALFPTFVFMELMLPKYFGWQGLFTNRPKLAAWWHRIGQDPEAAKVMAEVRNGLQGWVKNDRWMEQGIIEQVKDTRFKWSY